MGASDTFSAARSKPSHDPTEATYWLRVSDLAGYFVNSGVPEILPRRDLVAAAGAVMWDGDPSTRQLVARAQDYLDRWAAWLCEGYGEQPEYGDTFLAHLVSLNLYRRD
jgi:hypothetical protein